MVDEAKGASKPVRMENVWALIQQHIDDFGPSEAEIARRAGLTPQQLSQWKLGRLKKMPSGAALWHLSTALRRPYRDVLRAALTDWGYEPEEVVRDAATKTPAPADEPVNLADRRRPSSTTSTPARKTAARKAKPPRPT